ncbi:MAG: sodium-dependent transporter [Wenzhouxiangellaceae bacterium]|nr:sodium-dependent transporter [Wenzhouxiangellaceae bacterium]
MPQQQEQWSGRMAIVIAAVSMAVGTGNIWRFPRVVAEWGGGAFLVAVTVGLLLWALPLLMCEFLMGSKSRLGNIGAFRDFMGRRYTWAGAFMVAVTLGIMFYYSVVAGWCVRYFAVAASGGLLTGASEGALGQQQWDAFINNPVETVGYHAAAVLFTAFVVFKGIKGGLERVLKVFLVALLVILLVLAVRAVLLPGSAAGLRFLFVPDWSQLANARVWLEAFTQVAWSTGAGWGLLMVYAVYARQNEEITVNSGIVAFSDVLVGMVAAALVLGTLFALAPSAAIAEEALGAGHVGLTFIYIVDLIATTPGAWLISPLFFLALALAGVSSFIAMFELATTNLMNFGFQRRNAAVVIGLVAFALGIPSALSIEFLNNQDWVWGVGLLISGLLTALAILKYGVERARVDIDARSDINVGAWFVWMVRGLPVVFAVLFGWWLWQSIRDNPAAWWNPLETYSTGTLFLQWGVVLLLALALNRFFAERIKSGPMSQGGEHGR